MKVLVTGGGGFLGTEVCRQLKEQGHEVSSVSRSHYSHLEEMGVESLQADLSKGDLVDLTGFEAVIHTAAKAGVWGKANDYYMSNVVATENILEASKQAGVKYFVYTSSPSVVFGKDDIENGDESLEYPEKFYTEYAKTKSIAEKLVLSQNKDEIKCVSIRPHLIWGEGDPHIAPRIIGKARLGKLKIVGTGENLVDIIHVKNAALAHVLALNALSSGKHIAGRSYFVGQERPVNLWEFINQMLFQAGLEGIQSYVGFGTAYSVGFVLEKAYKLLGITSPEPPMTRFVSLQLAKSHYFSHQRAREDFGYEPMISIEEGLATLFSDKKKNLEIIESSKHD